MAEEQHALTPQEQELEKEWALTSLRLAIYHAQERYGYEAVFYALAECFPETPEPYAESDGDEHDG